MGERAITQLWRSLAVCLGLAGWTGSLQAADNLGSITVESQRDREGLRKQVDDFFSAAMVRQHNQESLLRWDQAMCPLVAGMSGPSGEFMLARISDAARASRVPLGPEKCRPNFFVIVAKRPEAFLRLWWHQHPLMYNTEFGIAPVKRFIETSRPIRVWRNVGLSAGNQAVVINGLLSMSTDSNMTIPDYPSVFGPATTLGSRLTHTTVRTITSVITIIDPAGVSGLNIGQLADYVSMVGFAEVNPDRDLGEVPTILKVFAPEGTPPLEMSVWDKALFHSLYSTPHASRMQLSQMETSAVKFLAERPGP